MAIGVRDRWHIFGIVAVTLVLGGLVFAAWYTDELRVRPPHYCPTGTWPQRHADIRVPGRTAILIDTSDSIGVRDGERAVEAIQTWTKGVAPFLQRLSIYGLRESPDREVEPFSESFCVPKQGSDVEPIYENPIFVEAEFRDFLARLEALLRIMIGLKEADESPIAETMADLVDQHEELDSFVLVSDMLQNTSAWSHYRQQGNADEAERVCGRITDAGRVRSVFVYYIDREREDIQSSEWPDDWWQNCLNGIETGMLQGNE